MQNTSRLSRRVHAVEESSGAGARGNEIAAVPRIVLKSRVIVGGIRVARRSEFGACEAVTRSVLVEAHRHPVGGLRVDDELVILPMRCAVSH
jgi:hypothetical protein